MLVTLRGYFLVRLSHLATRSYVTKLLLIVLAFFSHRSGILEGNLALGACGNDTVEE